MFQFEMKTNMKIPEFPMGQKSGFSVNSKRSLLRGHFFITKPLLSTSVPELK